MYKFLHFAFVVRIVLFKARLYEINTIVFGHQSPLYHLLLCHKVTVGTVICHVRTNRQTTVTKTVHDYSLRRHRLHGELTKLVRIISISTITRKGVLEKKKKKMSPSPSRQSYHFCTQNVISSYSTFLPSIIKIFRKVFVLRSRDKKSNSNTRRGDSPKSKNKSQSCHSCM